MNRIDYAVFDGETLTFPEEGYMFPTGSLASDDKGLKASLFGRKTFEFFQFTSLHDAAGQKLYEGQIVKPVRGFYSQKRFKDFTAEIVWHQRMWSLKWIDNYLNPLPLMNEGHFQILRHRREKSV